MLQDGGAMLFLHSGLQCGNNDAALTGKEVGLWLRIPVVFIARHSLVCVILVKSG